ncbi:MAG: hypothetical protein HXX13_09195 [Bacteroidetes bacterium]|nr:hypothetical protein [Bacteroidota bacterium]
MNNSFKILLSLILLCRLATAQSLTPSSVISDCVNFIKTHKSTTVSYRPEVDFDFSITDASEGILSGGYNSCNLTLDSTKNTLTGKYMYFLKCSGCPVKSTELADSPDQVFSLNTAAAGFANSTSQFGITYILSSPDLPVSNQVSLPNSASVVQIGKSTSGNEYILYGMGDPVNPARYLTIHIRQRMILIKSL